MEKYTIQVCAAVMFINGTNESAVPAFDAKAWATFFDTTTWIGAARSSDTWYQGWTCSPLIGEEAC